MTDSTAFTWDREKTIHFPLSFLLEGPSSLISACHVEGGQAASAIPDSARGSGASRPPTPKLDFKFQLLDPVRVCHGWLQRAPRPHKRVARKPGSPFPCRVSLQHTLAIQVSPSEGVRFAGCFFSRPHKLDCFVHFMHRPEYHHHMGTSLLGHCLHVAS